MNNLKLQKMALEWKKRQAMKDYTIIGSLKLK